jgi:uncharacterized protein YbjQ (UPF0145 family)
MLRVQVNRGLDGKFQKLENMLEEYRDLYLHEMASQLVLYSPVDTGTYITGHHVGLTAVGASRSSEGKQRQRDYEEFAQIALNDLSSEIEQLPENANSVVFSNDSFHSDDVEYEHGYAPYRKTAREHSRAAAKAAAEAKARNT